MSEYVELSVVKGDDFKALKRLNLIEEIHEHSQIVADLIIPKLKLQSEIELTKYDQMIKDFEKKKQRLATV
jgi:hypothetical protein